MVRSYWQRVVTSAWKQTTTTLGFASRGRVVITFLLFLVVLIGLVLWGSHDAAGDMALERAMAFGAVVLAIPFVYAWHFIRRPPQMEIEAVESLHARIGELDEQIQQLKDEREQVLAFDFRPEDNKFLELLKLPYKRRTEQYRVGRVAIKNLSHAKTAPNLHTTLIHYWKDGENIYNTVDILLTSWSSKQRNEDIPPRRSVTYDLFRVMLGQKVILQLGPLPDGTYKQIPHGRYRLKITASTATTPPLSGFFLLDVNADGKVEYRPWQTGDSTHVLERVIRP